MLGVFLYWVRITLEAAAASGNAPILFRQRLERIWRRGRR